MSGMQKRTDRNIEHQAVFDWDTFGCPEHSDLAIAISK